VGEKQEAKNNQIEIWNEEPYKWKSCGKIFFVLSKLLNK
jgi:hypothetical protein